jgi:hypothetical protein
MLLGKKLWVKSMLLGENIGAEFMPLETNLGAEFMVLGEKVIIMIMLIIFHGG